MIKATGKTGSGSPLLFLGLSGENVTRLAAGEPIKFDLAEVGMGRCLVVIHYGRTEAEIVDELASFGLVPPGFTP